jgi:hypothetical protein
LTTTAGTVVMGLVLLAPPQVVVRPPVPPRPLTPVAAVRILDGSIQHAKGQSWKAVGSDFRIAPGESLRTSPDGLAMLMFPWMEILVGGDSVLGITPSIVLSASLERGRIEEHARSGDILKVITAEAEVRGRGGVVVSRSETPPQTRVSSLKGWFRVKSARATVALDAGQGALVHADREPEIVDLPAAPTGLRPGKDPLYVQKGRTARLAWSGSAPRYHVQVLSLAGDEVILAREVQGSFLEVPGRWLGTFQWRVSSIDDRGMEGAPSAPGLFCVVEK